MVAIHVVSHLILRNAVHFFVVLKFYQQTEAPQVIQLSGFWIILVCEMFQMTNHAIKSRNEDIPFHCLAYIFRIQYSMIIQEVTLA